MGKNDEMSLLLLIFLLVGGYLLINATQTPTLSIRIDPQIINIGETTILTVSLTPNVLEASSGEIIVTSDFHNESTLVSNLESGKSYGKTYRIVATKTGEHLIFIDYKYANGTKQISLSLRLQVNQPLPN